MEEVKSTNFQKLLLFTGEQIFNSEKPPKKKAAALASAVDELIGRAVDELIGRALAPKERGQAHRDWLLNHVSGHEKVIVHYSFGQGKTKQREHERICFLFDLAQFNTPSLTTYFKSKKNAKDYFHLTKRFSLTVPEGKAVIKAFIDAALLLEKISWKHSYWFTKGFDRIEDPTERLHRALDCDAPDLLMEDWILALIRDAKALDADLRARLQRLETLWKYPSGSKKYAIALVRGCGPDDLLQSKKGGELLKRFRSDGWKKAKIDEKTAQRWLEECLDRVPRVDRRLELFAASGGELSPSAKWLERQCIGQELEGEHLKLKFILRDLKWLDDVLTLQEMKTLSQACEEADGRDDKDRLMDFRGLQVQFVYQHLETEIQALTVGLNKANRSKVLEVACRELGIFLKGEAVKAYLHLVCVSRVNFESKIVEKLTKHLQPADQGAVIGYALNRWNQEQIDDVFPWLLELKDEALLALVETWRDGWLLACKQPEHKLFGQMVEKMTVFDLMQMYYYLSFEETREALITVASEFDGRRNARITQTYEGMNGGCSNRIWLRILGFLPDYKDLVALRSCSKGMRDLLSVFPEIVARVGGCGIWICVEQERDSQERRNEIAEQLVYSLPQEFLRALAQHSKETARLKRAIPDAFNWKRRDELTHASFNDYLQIKEAHRAPAAARDFLEWMLVQEPLNHENWHKTMDFCLQQGISNDGDLPWLVSVLRNQWTKIKYPADTLLWACRLLSKSQSRKLVNEALNDFVIKRSNHRELCKVLLFLPNIGKQRQKIVSRLIGHVQNSQASHYGHQELSDVYRARIRQLLPGNRKGDTEIDEWAEEHCLYEGFGELLETCLHYSVSPLGQLRVCQLAPEIFSEEQLKFLFGLPEFQAAMQAFILSKEVKWADKIKIVELACTYFDDDSLRKLASCEWMLEQKWETDELDPEALERLKALRVKELKHCK